MSRTTTSAATIAHIAIAAFPNVAPLGAQRLGPEPPRPKGAVADTNDAKAYLDYGIATFETDPTTAAASFYWAARLNPGMAVAW
jgi:hypothetical protein